MIQQASREGLAHVTENGNRFTQANMLYRWICEAKDNGQTIAELVRKTKAIGRAMDKGTVSARLADLRRNKLITTQLVYSTSSGKMEAKRRDTPDKETGVRGTIFYSTTGDYQAGFKF